MKCRFYVPEELISPKSIRIQFLLPSASKMATLVPLMELAFQIIDIVAKIKLSKQSKDKANKVRTKAKQRASKKLGRQAQEDKRVAR